MKRGNSKGMYNICKLKYHYTYQTKNLINGKTYIGRHSTNNLNDGYLGSGKMLKRAIKKYGKENFECIPMCYFDTYEESVEEEKFLVTREYCNDKNNYNIVEGGSNPIMYGDMNPKWKGGIRSKRKYTKKGKPNFKKENNPFFGKTHSDNTKFKILESLRSRNVLTPIKVDDVIFNTLKECRNFYKIGYDVVMNRCISSAYENWNCLNEKSINDYKKSRLKKGLTLDPYFREKIISINNKKYSTFKEAMIELNISMETIQRRCVDSEYIDWYFINKELHDKYKNIVEKRIKRIIY